MTRLRWFVASSVLLLGACAQPASQAAAPAPPKVLTAEEAAAWVDVRHVIRENTRAVILIAGDDEPELQIAATVIQAAAPAHASIEALLTQMNARPVRVQVSLDPGQELSWEVVLEGDDGVFTVPVPVGVAGAFIVAHAVPVQARRGALFVHGRCSACGVMGTPDMKDPFSRRMARR